MTVDYFLSDHLDRDTTGGYILPDAVQIRRMRVVLLNAMPEPWWSITYVEAHRYDDRTYPLTGVYWRESPRGATVFADDVDYYFRLPQPVGYIILNGTLPVLGGTMEKHRQATAGLKGRRTYRGTIIWPLSGLIAPPGTETVYRAGAPQVTAVSP